MPKNKRNHNERGPVINEDEEVSELEKQVVATAPTRGTQPFTEASRDREPFSSLPISQRTLHGLTDGGFKTMTEIQVAAIPHALAGRDVLGAAKTGSGKTLAFLVPLVEKLYRNRVTFGDGLAALVISPTRELSLQIFEVLRAFGKHHQLSAGLITGGKKEFREEQASIVRVNILIATPGRLLQHLEQTPGFDPSMLQVLVLDEADRILDLGFREQLNSILEYLPPARQTMLFSATQTKSIKDLARLSLRKGDVEYVAVRAGKDECATPARLVQNYVVCELDKKLDVLLGFIKTHLKSKMIAFFSSCAQVRFVFELLCGLQPGTSIMALHGKCKHARRTQIYLEFLRKPGAVLLATDIASRGLDFPSVDWVIQVDAPEDAEGYIHRVGRTARYNKGGRALLMVVPSEEEGIMAYLTPKNIPIKRLTINPDKVRMAGSVGKKAGALVASNPDTKRLAEKAFSSYVRAVHLMPNKQAFCIYKLPLEKYAFSLGLAAVPRVPGVEDVLKGNGTADGIGRDEGNKCTEKQREEARTRKNTNRSLQRLKEQIKAEKQRKRLERASKQNGTLNISTRDQEARKPTQSRVDAEDSDDSDINGGLVLVRKGDRRGDDVERDNSLDLLPLQKKAKKLRITSDGVAAVAEAKKKVFDDDDDDDDDNGPEEDNGTSSLETEARKASDAYVTKVKARLNAVDDEDKARDRERVREKHLTRRIKDRHAKEGVSGATMVLGSVSDSDADETEDSRIINDVDNKSDAFGSLHIEPFDCGSNSDDGHVDSGSDSLGETGNRQTTGRSGDKSLLMLQNHENAVLAMLSARLGQ